MFRLLFLSISFLFFISYASSQIIESEIAMSKGTENAFSFKIKDYNYKIAQTDWKSYIKSLDGKAKKDKKTKEFTVLNILLSNIAETPINLYTTFNKSSNKKDCEISVWFDLSESYCSSKIHPNKIEGVNKFINDFILFAQHAELERKIAASKSSEPKPRVKAKVTSGRY